MARVCAHLNFPGSTEEDFVFYKSLFGTQFDGSIARLQGHAARA